ncbi:MAG: hypothetical protein R3C60_00365 [Parvularculaceae bacterium]
MPSVTIRNVDPEVHRRLRIRAAMNGRSMEGEIRAILTIAATRANREKSAETDNSGRVVNGAGAVQSSTEEADIALTKNDAIAKVRKIIREQQTEDAA